jgi:hypothetical protein
MSVHFMCLPLAKLQATMVACLVCSWCLLRTLLVLEESPTPIFPIILASRLAFPFSNLRLGFSRHKGYFISGLIVDSDRALCELCSAADL